MMTLTWTDEARPGFRLVDIVDPARVTLSAVQEQALALGLTVKIGWA